MLPRGWRIKKLRELVGPVDAGVSVNGEDRSAGLGEFGVLKISSVTAGVFRPALNKAIRADELQRAAVHPLADAILICRSNTAALVGASAYVERNYANLYLPDTLWQLQSAPASGTHMPWLKQWIASDTTRSSLSKLATGSRESNLLDAQLDLLRKEKAGLMGMALTLFPTRDRGALSFVGPVRAEFSTMGRVLVVAFAFAARCARVGCSPGIGRSA